MVAAEPVRIGRRQVGPGKPVFIVAEAGVNHDGDVRRALALVEAAKAAGADAVKFQTFRAEALAVAAAPTARYQRGMGRSQLRMLRRLELDAAAHRRLLSQAKRRGLMFLSTPFDEESLAFLDALGVPAIKIGSGDLTNAPLLKAAARTGRPIILSTGMASLPEVRRAVGALQAAGNHALVLLHCVSQYPAPASAVNLRAMDTLVAAFEVPVGFSDHTLGSAAAVAAVARGACVVEKHLTLDRRRSGPDHAASIEPDEFRSMVESIRTVETALGDGGKRPTPGEAEVAAVARKSLFAACDIPAGTRLTSRFIAVKRPGTGLPPTSLARVLGRRARQTISADTQLALTMLR